MRFISASNLKSTGDFGKTEPLTNYAQQFKSKISCIYIGPENGLGADFLKRLSAVTGGQFSNSGVAGIGHLSQTVQVYLTA